MPRPPKCRRVCHFPQTLAFSPEDDDGEKSAVTMTVDEYETIRLIDKEGMSQEQCSSFMQIARTTVQQIYAGARRKLADMLVDGLPLRIEGGEYELCSGENHVCCACPKHHFCQMYEKPKGEKIMRIAVTYENGEIFQHFGHTENFKIYDVDGDKLLSSQVVSTNGSGHGALAGVLRGLQVDALICGGIGGGAQAALAAEGIKLYGGASGNADDAVAALIAGKLAFDPNVQCNHHGEHHHHEGACGQHGCGEHHCENH